MAEPDVEHTPVLVVGGSMVGLTMSILLAQHGLKGCITVEKHPSTAIHPRAAVFQPRTMQIYREMGLYDEMLAESQKHFDERAAVVEVESLAGKLKRVFLSNINEGIEKISPVKRLFLTQWILEPILRQKATALGADVRFSHELLSFTQDSTGVDAKVLDITTNTTRRIRASYLVGADGYRSTVRSLLGVPMHGRGVLSRAITIYFRMDCTPYISKQNYTGVIYVATPALSAFFRLDANGREGFLCVMRYGTGPAAAHPADRIDADPLMATTILRAAVGDDAARFDITGVGKWNAVTDLAARFVQARVLLAGDSAHNIPPQGGFGGNTGVQDAHNLAFKLGLVGRGVADARLVGETYEAERRPWCAKTVRQVYTRYTIRTAPELAAEDAGGVEAEVPDPWLELGYCYATSRGLVNAGYGIEGEDVVRGGGEGVVQDPETAVARPGGIAFHVVVSTVDGAFRDVPVGDFFGYAYVLLVAHEGEEWEGAGKEMAERSEGEGGEKLALMRAYRIVKECAFSEKYGVGSKGAVLVRPDGFVAWRAEDERVPDDIHMNGVTANGHSGGDQKPQLKALEKVMRRILCFDD